MYIALFRPYMGLWEFFPQKGKHRPFCKNPKSAKIISITAFINKKNAKYLTKHESLYILRFNFLIWNSP